MKQYFIAIFMALTLCGCGADTEPKAQDAAIGFFDAIYNQGDVNKAASFCTPHLAEEVKKHMTAKNVARRMFNMSFDSVQIDAGLGDVKVREEFNTTGQLTILFTGNRQDKIFKELKTVKLVKNGNSWLVDEIVANPILN